MAKYLVDSNTRVDSSWFDLADEICKSVTPEAHPEIPQLWNMRGNSRIKVKDGRVVDMFTGGQSSLQAIYGGVEFGLDRFQLSQRTALQGSTGMPGMQLGQTGRPMFMPQRFQLQQRGETPQGVDLNLDKFSLSSPERFAACLPACSAAADSLEARTTLGKAFLKSLQGSNFPNLKEDDKDFLLGVYTSPQCDRIEEGDAFIPPDPNLEYVAKVRNLLNEEKTLFERRRLAFCDKSFVASNPGYEFPRSWTSRFQIEQEGRSGASVPNKAGLAKIEADDTLKVALLQDILPTAAPEFHEVTEDGVIFRIYKIGSLEVRTVQRPSGAEVLGAVFSSGAPSWELTSRRQSKPLRDDEKLHECKIYIEAMGGSGKERPPCQFYVVFQTDAKNVLVTEKLASGATTWAVNPGSLEDRNSLAKLLFTTDCNGQVAVSELKTLQVKMNQAHPQGVAPSARKHYIKSIFKQICGRGFRGKWGGLVRRYSGPSVFRGLPTRSSASRSTEFSNGMWTANKNIDLLGKRYEINRPQVSVKF
eukprot:TRINITY_DN6137_c1_g3_i1.p1 TRINITY_DN6137_c1_g3~~TRINITY_DN6137_c1_g3_i1.p1  ORF type:complete len:542 (+),score=114.15 TRINITY_DN6137_c1_g3_i1:35-1627(+)